MRDIGNSELSTKALNDVVNNAFRVLGLPGNATQSAINNKQKYLLRHLKIQSVVTNNSEWCLSLWFNSLNIKDSDVQSAIGKLNDAKQRFKERLYWFIQDDEDIENLLNGSMWNVDISEVYERIQGVMFMSHDGALLCLISSVFCDPFFRNIKQWTITLSSIYYATSNHWLVDHIANIEMNGQFYQSSDAELEKIETSALHLLLKPFDILLDEMVYRKDYDACERVLKIMQQLDFMDKIGDIHDKALRYLAQDIENSCEEFIQMCDNTILHEDDAGQQNQHCCESLERNYIENINSKADRFLKLASNDIYYVQEVKEAMARCLYVLGMGYTWADNIEATCRLLKKGERIGESTRIEPHIRDALKKIENEAFASLCSKVIEYCDKNIRRTEEEVDYNKNICKSAMDKLNREIQPQFDRIIGRYGNESELGQEARNIFTQFLYVLALGLTWADDYKLSIKLLKQAKEICIIEAMKLKIEETENNLQSVAYRQLMRKAAMHQVNREHTSNAYTINNENTSTNIFVKLVGAIGITGVVLVVLLGISFISVIFNSTNKGNTSTSNPNYSGQVSQADKKNINESELINNLQKQIELGRKRIKSLEEELKDISNELEQLKQRINLSKSLPQTYNMLVNEYNEKVNNYQLKYNEYERLLNTDRALVSRYNSLIKE